jgi:hypothetical protein
MKNKIFINTDENKFAREVLPKQSGLFLVKGSIKLDDTHLSLPTETFLVIFSAVRDDLHSLVICSQGAFFDDVKVWDIEDGAITEGKLDTALTGKVNNNVKTVAQTLTDLEVDTACKNLKFRDANGNFFADRKSYDEVAKLSIAPKFSMFGNNCFSNTFGEHCSYNTFGNNLWGNTFGNFCADNTFGLYCNSNKFGNDCSNNIFGSNCSNNIFGNFFQYAKIDSGVIYIELKSNTNPMSPLKNIHILSGVRGKSRSERLVINIPDEYLNSSRELIITTKRTDGGPSTPEDIVMYYADEVVDKQNKQDNTLATTSKEVVGAINELFNGGVKDKSIEIGKLAQAVQDTLGKVGARVKVLSSGTDLKAVTEAGVYILSGTANYLNAPNNWEHYNTAILIVSGDGSDYNNGKTIIGFQNGSQYPFAATLRNNEWIETDFEAIKYSYTPVQLTATTSTNKTQLDLFLSKVPTAQVMHCTYKDVYAGTLHKINGSWYGVLVGESNTLAGQLSIKLQADGTIIEGTA